MSIEDIVSRALDEDVGSGDITTELCVPADAGAVGRFIAREPIVVAGLEVLPLLFDHVEIEIGETLATVRGPARQLLTHERVALNFLQRMSGIATLTRKYVDAVAGTRCRILDTRKTTPGLRLLEKAAVKAGGATNHRMGLYDAVLIKNNHITAAGGVTAALARVKNANVPVEIEVRTRAELNEALAAGATHLLLDNLNPAEAREWINHIKGRATVELSGGITLENVRAYAEAGADYVSVGALTHSARAVDINFRLQLE
ncbi:MAG TPA: carboxylating nicotinate-nucleotide diphosphorylase [Bryobacteraceae bacterium]|nr:carboxylating nicotinate-nucleotide diphosphorylase [Bryobacteraceae bacterium]